MRRERDDGRRVVILALLAVLLVAGCQSSGPHRSASTSAKIQPDKTSARSAGSAGSAAPSTTLPLALPTLDARQVLTVVATSANATSATLQAWTRTGADTWTPHGTAITAHLGQGGITAHEHESSTATPSGSFTLTQAFGRRPNPGTRLPFIHTTPRDWWISEPGPQHAPGVRGEVPFHTGSPNTQLFAVRPQYDLGVVIDYNRNPVVL